MAKDNKYERLISTRMSSSPDIVENDFSAIKGRVITLGDIHGSTAFDRVIKGLGSEDRLVLVGDLIDRGPDSFKVLQRVKEDPRIIAIRGNHEEMFLRYMKSRMTLGENLSNDIKKAFDECMTLLKKGELKRVDFESSLLRKSKIDKYSKSKEEKAKIENAKKLIDFFYNGGDWAQDNAYEKLEPLFTYIDELPYIRKVITHEGPFLVAHADVSILSDEKIDTMLKEKNQLTNDQKSHITWARADPKSERPVLRKNLCRNRSSIRTYVGHEITVGGDISVFRGESNHCDLDFGAYLYGTLVGVEHPQKVVVFGDFSPKCRPKDKEQFYTQLCALKAGFQEIEFDSVAGLQQYQNYLSTNGIAPDENCHVRLTQAQFNQDFNTSNLHYFKNAVLSGVSLTQDQFDKLCKLHDIQITKSQFYKLYNAHNDSGEQSIVLKEVIALHTDAPLLSPEQRFELLVAQQTVNNNKNSENASVIMPGEPFLPAMDAAIASCGQSGDLGKEKKQTLEALRNRYATLVEDSDTHFLELSAASAYANTLIKTFVSVAATERTRKYGWMTAQYGDTKSVNAFHKAIKNDPATLDNLRQALGANTSGESTSNNIAQFKNFKNCLETMKAKEQAPDKQETPTHN